MVSVVVLVGGTRAETEALVVGAAMRSTGCGLMINGADGWDANSATLTSVIETHIPSATIVTMSLPTEAGRATICRPHGWLRRSTAKPRVRDGTAGLRLGANGAGVSGVGVTV